MVADPPNAFSFQIVQSAIQIQSFVRQSCRGDRAIFEEVLGGVGSGEGGLTRLLAQPAQTVHPRSIAASVPILSSHAFLDRGLHGVDDMALETGEVELNTGFEAAYHHITPLRAVDTFGLSRRTDRILIEGAGHCVSEGGILNNEVNVWAVGAQERGLEGYLLHLLHRSSCPAFLQNPPPILNTPALITRRRLRPLKARGTLPQLWVHLFLVLGFLVKTRF